MSQIHRNVRWRALRCPLFQLYNWSNTITSTSAKCTALSSHATNTSPDAFHIQGTLPTLCPGILVSVSTEDLYQKGLDFPVSDSAVHHANHCQFIPTVTPSRGKIFLSRNGAGTNKVITGNQGLLWPFIWLL